jgi:uncharacterized membrane protein YphA (DoxX/SURF4 family)
MDDTAIAFVLITRLALGSIFIWTGATKLGAGDLGTAISRYGIVPAPVARPLAAILPPAELLLGGLLLLGAFVPVALLAGAVLIGVFATAMVVAMRSGRAIPCGCLGDRSALVGPGTIARNVLFVIAAAAATHVSYSLVIWNPAAAWDAAGLIQAPGDAAALAMAVVVAIAVFVALPELDTVRAWRNKQESGNARWSLP